MSAYTNFADIRFTVVCDKVEDHFAEFSIYEIVSLDPIVQWKQEGGNSHDFVDDVTKAERFAYGSVKWDGCSNWMFEDQERGCMLHGCERTDLVNIGEVLARTWDWASKLIPRWEGT